MAKRERISARQRAAGEAGRRAAAVARLAGARPPGRRPRPHDAAAGIPYPARAGNNAATPTGDAKVSVCAPGCRVRAGAREEFAALRAASLLRRRRFGRPGRCPCAAGKHTLHRTTRRQSTQPAGGLGEDGLPWLRGALTRFAHDGVSGSGWAIHMRVIKVGEAAARVRERTGPRYRLCGIRTPALPKTGKRATGTPASAR